MNPVNRPPPAVLLVHNGVPYERHLQHLTSAGLRVSDVHADAALSAAIQGQPDIIVLDWGCNGDVVALLKNDPSTANIPIIALAELVNRDS